ncbi:NAD(P)-dependent dehydrogenase (short-subunit alcohol dehydrogenase family) [Rhodococcus rhodochrous J45]|uniref:NAD(P)-dependent dehydrogenase (Short-subunit alcohol dehydrogenase family) n=1 Tax=Rhodococcus rhodochrous J45 TaxID=935266 RepID=A0A562E2J5_RHORH|nr:SDR family oxidoreductase [Rhodococcus rhodochrous]TWH16070.1 NAD(P)-dependent dehydrogenase (short-subunit alcohol dehydrogenase family) [Rhodococcus rhodochrous J45]
MNKVESDAAHGAILTGAGGGIGAATAIQLARDGFALALVDRDQQQLDRAEESVLEQVPNARVRTYVGDVTDGDSVESYARKAREELGPIGLLVNNAGIEGRVCAIHEYSEEEFDKVWAVNARGAWLNIKHAVPLLRENGGVIVNIASVAAIRSSVLLAPYVASKHAVLGLTRAAASDLAPHGIRVNAICPGPVDTRMIESLGEQRIEATGSDGTAGLLSRVLLGRLADPSEIASVVGFLASPAASFMTGSAIVADGGLTI